MGNCAKLKWNRKKLGLTQKQFAKAAGLDVGTINKLENDETAWLTVRRETEDRIYKMYEGVDVWAIEPVNKGEDKPVEPTEIKQDNKVLITEVTQEMVDRMAAEEARVQKLHSLTAHDNKIMTLMEFAYEGLTESKSHEEFEANLNMIRRILNKY